MERLFDRFCLSAGNVFIAQTPIMFLRIALMVLSLDRGASENFRGLNPALYFISKKSDAEKANMNLMNRDARDAVIM